MFIHKDDSPSLFSRDGLELESFDVELVVE